VKVAIVIDWLEVFGGAERVIAELAAYYPQADFFAVADFMDPKHRGFLGGRPVQTSFIQRLPFARKKFRSYLPLMPLAVEQFDMTGYDLVISSSHAIAKGVITGPDQVHVSYTHTPMRYLWDMQGQYLRQTGLDHGLRGVLARTMLHVMRNWDVRSATGVDSFIANSSYIARRIHKVYRRESTVVAPPVDVDAFTMGRNRGDAYLVVARMVPYKRIDLVVKAFASMPNRKLTVVGDGPERQRIQAAAKGASNITFAGVVPHETLVRLMQEARAFVFAGEEDFGISLVEAQACGTPVIAFGYGGARDIVVRHPEAPTGLLFDHQTQAAIAEAVWAFEAEEHLYNPDNCRANALRFSPAAFRVGLQRVIDRAFRDIGRRRHGVPEPRQREFAENRDLASF
jgi:glycosyltransferase involved in cell wall biosynthesis